MDTGRPRFRKRFRKILKLKKRDESQGKEFYNSCIFPPNFIQEMSWPNLILAAIFAFAGTDVLEWMPETSDVSISMNLPDEIITMIMQNLLSISASYVGLLRKVSNSFQWNELVNVAIFRVNLEFYVSPEICSSLNVHRSNAGYRWISLQNLLSNAGLNSGLGQRLKFIFERYKPSNSDWKNGSLCVKVLKNSWYSVYDFSL